LSIIGTFPSALYFAHAVLFDTEEVRDFVQDGPSYLKCHFVLTLAGLFDGVLKDGDAVGSYETVVMCAFCQRHTLIEAKERLPLRDFGLCKGCRGWSIFDEDDDIVEEFRELLWQRVEDFLH